MRARHAALPREDPPRHQPFVRTQHPALACGQIGESERGFIAWGKLILATDRLEKVERGVIGGEEEMIAVVDRDPKRRLEIRAAAAACVGRELMQDDLPASTHEAHCCCE